jgi:hypothetical protein
VTAPAPLSGEELDALAELEQEATPGPWEFGRPAVATEAEAVACFLHAYRGGPEGSFWVNWVVDSTPVRPEDNSLYVAVTGNGPTSEANARFNSAARNALPRLIAQVRELQRELLREDGRRVDAEKAAEQHRIHGSMFARAADTEKAEAKTQRARAEAAERTVAEQAAKIGELEAALKELGMRQSHACSAVDDCDMVTVTDCIVCTCGVDEHNAKVAAVLAKGRP